jgi:hypothetical protein
MANYPDLKLYGAGEWRQADGQPVMPKGLCKGHVGSLPSETLSHSVRRQSGSRRSVGPTPSPLPTPAL